jgi:putative (di)nucleoside polyphosphate hydrolase
LDFAMSCDALLRPAVLLVLRDSSGRVLVGERRDFPGCWQFPQGGCKEGETRIEALRRETLEEVGLPPSDYSTLEQLGVWAYKFPTGVRKKGYVGQELAVFLADYSGEPAWDKKFAGSKEFSRIAWLELAEIPWQRLPEFKRSFYEEVLARLRVSMNATKLSQTGAASIGSLPNARP